MSALASPTTTTPTPTHVPTTAPLRAALYIRVSTSDGRQTTENQRPVLEQFAARRGWSLVHVYEDHESGASANRTAFQVMLADAEAKRFDVLVFWALDRFTREGSYPTLSYLDRLSSWGVGWVSYQEQYLDSTGIFRDAIVAILGAIAQQERLRMSERIKAGQLRATKEGKVLGKPPVCPNIDYFRRANAVYDTEELMELFQCCRQTVSRWRTRLRQIDSKAANPQT